MKVVGLLILACSSAVAQAGGQRGAQQGTASIRGNGRRLMGGGMGGMNGSGEDEVPPLGPGQCLICTMEAGSRPNSLALEWNPNGATSLFQADKATCVEGDYPESTTVTLEDGTSFSVSPGSQFVVGNGVDELETNTLFTIEGWTGGDGDDSNQCEFHTSCSAPLVVGDQIGPFVLTEGNECLPCEICGYDKTRPDSLTFMYQSVGLDSEYQDRDGTCGAGIYRSQGARVTANGQVFTGLRDGDIFTVQGPFDATTEFRITNDGLTCEIHTSCSDPLIPEDNFGPFKLLGGGFCPYAPPPSCPEVCSAVDTSFCGEEVCGPDNVSPPPELTFRYNAGQGVDSLFPQGSMSAVTCDSSFDFYFDVEVFVNEQTFFLTEQQIFTVTGPFINDELVFQVRNLQDPTEMITCAIDVSCGSSLVTGDRFGAFGILGGNGCLDETPQCIQPTALEYDCGEPITFEFSYEDQGPLDDDWIGIYPCPDQLYYHAEVWKWACDDPRCENAIPEGSITFDSLPSYNQAGPHYWPVTPVRFPDGVETNCFRALLLRNDGPSVPPYVEVCKSAPFFVNVDNSPECPTRDTGFPAT